MARPSLTGKDGSADIAMSLASLQTPPYKVWNIKITKGMPAL